MALIMEPDHGTPASGDARTVELTIDGQTVTVAAGTSIMRAASLAGIDIPKLCAMDRLEAFGSCRVCLVEIDGRPGTPASCTTPVAEGMVVRTETEQVNKLRHGVMELYFSDHPREFLERRDEGEAAMHDIAERVGVNEIRYGQDGATHLCS